MAGKACVLFNKPAAFSMGLPSKNALIGIVSLLAREVNGSEKNDREILEWLQHRVDLVTQSRKDKRVDLIPFALKMLKVSVASADKLGMVATFDELSLSFSAKRKDVI